MSKRKILTLALTVCMIAILAVGGTLAYLIDTDHQLNTFTAGKIFIELDETKITGTDDNGFPEYSETERTSDEQSYKLRPGLTAEKDPKITLNAGSEDAYMGAIIKISCEDAKVYDELGNETNNVMGLYDLFGVEGAPNIDITKAAANGTAFVTGGLLNYASEQKTDWNGLPMVYENVKCVIYQDASQAEAKNEWTLYIFLKNVYQRDDDEFDDEGNLTAGGDNNEEYLFTALNVPAEYTSSQMAVLGNLKIDITAYAAQVEGFDNCFDALTTAFPDAWGVLKN